MEIDKLPFWQFAEVIASRFQGAVPKSNVHRAERIGTYKYFAY